RLFADGADDAFPAWSRCSRALLSQLWCRAHRLDSGESWGSTRTPRFSPGGALRNRLRGRRARVRVAADHANDRACAGGCSRRVASAGVRAVRMLHRAPGHRPESRPTARGTRVARDVHRRMAFIGFVLALMFFCHLKRRLRAAHREAIDSAARHDDHQPPWEQWRTDWRRQWAEWNRHWADQAQCYGNKHADWHRQGAAKREQSAE